MKKINILKALILSVFFTGIFASFEFVSGSKIVVNSNPIVKSMTQSQTVILPTQSAIPNVEASAVVINPSEDFQIPPPPIQSPSNSTSNSFPTRLTIPAATVDAHIMSVGVTTSNNLDVPPNFVDVGWYKLGPKPGELGSVVLDGHVDNGAAIDGVFKHLRNIKNGDDIFITMNDGQTLHYRAVSSMVYPTNQFPSNTVFNQNDQPYLKIITCHGTFVPSLKTYDERLIVTAILVK